jgi:hypothetical protein
LQLESVRKSLDLTPAQVKQLQQIAVEYGKRLQEAVNKAARQDELQRSWYDLAVQVRHQIESVLTPKQLTALMETIVRRIEPDALMDAKVQERLEISREQKETLSRIRQQRYDRTYRIQQQMEDDAIGIFTQTQRQKLRDECDRRNGVIGPVAVGSQKR